MAERFTTTQALGDVERERIRQLEKYPPEHDRARGIDHLIEHAGQVARGGARGCGYYHRDDLVEAAAMLVAAVELMDAIDREPGAHLARDCRG